MPEFLVPNVLNFGLLYTGEPANPIKIKVIEQFHLIANTCFHWVACQTGL
jgi:hypothetical protein